MCTARFYLCLCTAPKSHDRFCAARFVRKKLTLVLWSPSSEPFGLLSSDLYVYPFPSKQEDLHVHPMRSTARSLPAKHDCPKKYLSDVSNSCQLLWHHIKLPFLFLSHPFTIFVVAFRSCSSFRKNPSILWSLRQRLMEAVFHCTAKEIGCLCWVPWHMDAHAQGLPMPRSWGIRDLSAHVSSPSPLHETWNQLNSLYTA